MGWLSFERDYSLIDRIKHVNEKTMIAFLLQMKNAAEMKSEYRNQQK